MIFMEKGYRHDNEDFDARIKACGVSEPVSTYLSRCAQFHSSPAPGLLIGAFMVDYALELLGAQPGEKLFSVCETPKCLPDAPQVIAHATTGNGRLKVVPIGRFALTMNRASDKPTTDGSGSMSIPKRSGSSRSLISGSRTASRSTSTRWERISRSRSFVPGRKILSGQKVRVPVKIKEAWQPVTCPTCGETVPDYLVVDGKCGACGPMKYYEKSRPGGTWLHAMV